MQKLYNKKKTTIIIDYLQLIKYTEDAINTRSQEIANITRELKLLAKYIQSPVIVLSQLNRNIENRINQRPLLSDLRESGCLSCHNIPTIAKSNHKNYIESLYCLNTFYLLQTQNNLKINEKKEQYIYYINSYNKNFLELTHNHKILINKRWIKEDQIKENQLNNILLSNHINTNFILELNLIKNINKLIKTQVYDIALEEFQNFTVNSVIIHNSIEQDADLILMLYKAKENKNEKIIDIIIAKHRNGSIGSFQLFFYKETGQFKNIEDKEFI